MYELTPATHNTTLTIHMTGDVLMDDVASFNKVMREHSKTPDITQLVLDLSQVGRMDFAGLGVLVSLSTSMQRYGRRLVLLSPATHVEQLLKDAEIEGFFATCQSEEELRGFIPEATSPRREK